MIYEFLSSLFLRESINFEKFNPTFVVIRARIGASPALLVRALRRKKVTQNRFLSIVQNSV